MRSRLRSFLVRRNIQNKGSTFDHVGITPLELKEYLANHPNFKRGGFDWFENRHRWHIDHIMPLDAINDMIKDMDVPQDVATKRLSHWSNLQPLKAEHNLSKSNKIPTNWVWKEAEGKWGYSDDGERGLIYI